MATSEVTLWTEPTVLVGPVVQAKLLGTVFNRLGWLFHHRWGFKRQTLAFNLQIFEIHVCGCECVYCNVYICYGIHPDVHCLCGNCFGLIEDLAQRTWGQSISRIGSPSLQTWDSQTWSQSVIHTYSFPQKPLLVFEMFTSTWLGAYPESHPK